jgi:hypothetical protein
VCLVGDCYRRRVVLVAAVDVDSLQLVVNGVTFLVVTISSSFNTYLCPIGEARDQSTKIVLRNLGLRIAVPGVVKLGRIRRAGTSSCCGRRSAGHDHFLHTFPQKVNLDYNIMQKWLSCASINQKSTPRTLCHAGLR